MEVHGEGLSLHMNRGVDAQVVAHHLIPIAHHYSEGVCGLGTQAQGSNEALLHEVVRATAIDKNDHGVFGNLAHQAQSLWGLSGPKVHKN